MATFTTTAVERFIKSGVPMGKPHTSLREGRGLCLRLLPTGAASWQFVYRPAALVAPARRRPSRSARGRRLTCARRPKRPADWRAKSPQAVIPAPISTRLGGASGRSSWRLSTTTKPGSRVANCGRPGRRCQLCGGAWVISCSAILQARPRRPDRRDRADRAQRQARSGARVPKALAHVPQPPAFTRPDRHRSAGRIPHAGFH